MSADDKLSSTQDRQTAIAKLQQISPEFVDLIAKFPIAQVQERAVLSEREREIIALVSLVGLGTTERLKGHFESALATGMSKAELSELVLQTSIYTGFPKAVDAMLALHDLIESREVS